MIPIEDAVRYMEADVVKRASRIGVYWFECGADRRGAHEGFAGASSSVCIVPLMPQRGFDNTNALFVDLIDLLQQKREVIEEVLNAAAIADLPLCIVLISRRRLDEPVLASPVKMPEWFPYCGGDVISLDLLDIGSSATGTLRSQGEGILRLQIALYEIEGIMLGRVSDALRCDKKVTQQFFSLILRDEINPAAFLELANQKHKRSSPDGFRAVASPNSAELLGRLLGTVANRSPSQLPTLGRALFSALRVEPEAALQIREPLVGVLLRSTSKELEEDSELRAMRNTLVALYGSSQLVTAAAHSGEYGDFEIVIMRSVFMDCHATLTTVKAVLS